MKLVIGLVVLVAPLTLISSPSHASLFCSEPREPYCVDGSGYFDDESQFNSCKSEVEDYLRDVKEYSQCLAEEQNKAIEKSNEIIEKFNCRAAGKSFC
jgi:hypothetical protein